MTPAPNPTEQQLQRRAIALAKISECSPHFDNESVQCIMVIVIELGLEEVLAKASCIPAQLIYNWADGTLPFGTNGGLAAAITTEMLNTIRVLPAYIELEKPE